jgi:hypothetical protein
MPWRQGPTYHGQGSLRDNLTVTIHRRTISCADVEGAFGACTESVCSMEVPLKTKPVRISTGMESILT